jgi:predicted site-specific integrase-resolvase
MAEIQRLMTVSEVAEVLSVRPRTLHVWQRVGKGPRPIRVGKFLRYEPAAVRAWLAERSELAK